MTHTSTLSRLIHLYRLSIVHTQLLLDQDMFTSSDGSKCNRSVVDRWRGNNNSIDSRMVEQFAILCKNMLHAILPRTPSQQIDIGITKRHNLRLWTEPQPRQMYSAANPTYPYHTNANL